MKKHIKKPIYLSLLLLLTAMTLSTTDLLAQSRSGARRGGGGGGVASRRVPVGTELKIRLENEIDTKESNDGDKFTATVLTPSRYADATIEGHIAKIDKSGKLKGKTELSLSFDRIRLSNGGSQLFGAQVVRVYGEDSVKEVDEEGNVKSGSKGKTTAVRTGGGAAVGAIIGAIAGGGKGAAIGAAVGAGVGAGSTYIQGSNKVKLDSGTEILIRSTR